MAESVGYRTGVKNKQIFHRTKEKGEIMGIIGKVHRKIQEVGLKNCIRGAVLRERYKRLQKKYGFDTWHFSPYEWREYLQKTAAYINAHQAKKVVDIGCGLGGLLRHIEAPTRIGIDIHEDVILAAKELSDKSIAYRVGSFNKVVGEDSVDYLITLNFTHGGMEEAWKEAYHTIAERNDIRHFVVDTVPEDGSSHFLNYRSILPKNYVMIERMGPFLGGRCIEIWEKK